MNRLTKEFKRFWGAQSLSMLGNQASSFVWTTLLVTSYSISSEQISGINALIQGITVVLPVLVAPYLKKRNLFSEIAFLDILRGICYTLIGILCFLEMLPVYLFVVIVIVAETLGKIFSPLFYVSPIYLVEDIDRTVANSRIATSESVTEIIGAPFGSILYTYVGPFAAFVLNAISFFVGGHTSLQLKTHWNMPDTKNSMHYWRDICNGFRQVIQEPSLRKITMNTLIYNLAAGAMISVFPILVLRDMALSGSTYALIISIGACGGVVASLVAPVITQKIGFRFTLMVGILIQIPELRFCKLNCFRLY